MLATELAQLIYLKKIVGNLSEVMIDYLAQDSRKVRPNTLFFCIDGVTVDGHRFAAAAKEKGAVAFVASKSIKDQVGDTPVIYVKDVTRVMALLANHFYGYPTQSLQMIGVTGTNGKTTVTHMIDALLEKPNKPTALIGTIYRKIGPKIIQTHNTTPEILTLHETFQELKEIGGETCLMEVSSHALQLGRVWGLDYDCVVFTNLTHEHLDLHKTMEQYAHAKSLLFSQLGNYVGENSKPKVAVLNADDEQFQMFEYSTPAQVISYGITANADFKAENIRTENGHTIFELVIQQEERYLVDMPILGIFNVYNILSAIAVAYVYGISIEEILGKVKAFKGVAGRMQAVDKGQDFQVIVDFAHTPDGLENVLDSLAQIPHGKIITVVGHSGGNRDSSMRPELGRIALTKSDHVVFTADNPRTEPLVNIYEGLLSAVDKNSVSYECIDKREDAIEKALQLASVGDIVLLAGKGVEPYQIIGEVEYPYNEIEIVESLLENR